VRVHKGLVQVGICVKKCHRLQSWGTVSQFDPISEQNIEINTQYIINAKGAQDPFGK
jgi:hypothetical protein